jgi:hypothetical protein
MFRKIVLCMNIIYADFDSDNDISQPLEVFARIKQL